MSVACGSGPAACGGLALRRGRSMPALAGIGTTAPGAPRPRRQARVERRSNDSARTRARADGPRLAHNEPAYALSQDQLRQLGRRSRQSRRSFHNETTGPGGSRAAYGSSPGDCLGCSVPIEDRPGRHFRDAPAVEGGECCIRRRDMRPANLSRGSALSLDAGAGETCSRRRRASAGLTKPRPREERPCPAKAYRTLP